jgi:hypothetical protein
VSLKRIVCLNLMLAATVQSALASSGYEILNSFPDENPWENVQYEATIPEGIKKEVYCKIKTTRYKKTSKDCFRFSQKVLRRSALRYGRERLT